MSKYIFLTNAYLPKPGATGMCVHQIAKELSNRGHEVVVLCYEDQDGTGKFNYDGIIVYKIKIPFFLKDVSHENYIIRLLTRYVSLFAKLLHLNKYPLRSNTLVRRYTKRLSLLLRQNPESTVISTFTPLETNVAVIKVLRDFKVKHSFFYSTDTLSAEQGNQGYLSPTRREELGYKWEQAIFSVFDKIIIMECHWDYYHQKKYSPYWGKMIRSNFPLLSKSVNTNKNINTSNVKSFKLYYAGTLYRNLRNPEFAARVLLDLSKALPIQIKFMGGGDCGDILNKYVDLSNGTMEYTGMVPYSQVCEELEQADVLLSIGNAESPMMPSKVFEYMATGKPIIHFFSWDKDPCIEPLKKYGNSYLLCSKDKYDIKELISFIENSHIVDFSYVESIFKTSTPAYSADIISGKLA